MVGTGEHGQRAPQVAGGSVCASVTARLWLFHGRLSACCAGSVGMAASCISRLAVRPRADARRVAATRQAAQTHRHRPQHPAPGTAAPVRPCRYPLRRQPVQSAAVKTRCHRTSRSRPWCTRPAVQQSAQQVVAHDMHAHPGIKGQLGHPCRRSLNTSFHPAQHESCFIVLAEGLRREFPALRTMVR